MPVEPFSQLAPHLSDHDTRKRRHRDAMGQRQSAEVAEQALDVRRIPATRIERMQDGTRIAHDVIHAIPRFCTREREAGTLSM